MSNDRIVALADVRDQVRTGAARAIRIAAGLTQAEVARAIGVSRSTVWRWEEHERSPRGEAALRFGALLADLASRTSPRGRRPDRSKAGR